MSTPTDMLHFYYLKVNGGSQSFNVVNTLRILGRWMRMVTIPNQSSVPKAWTEFDSTGRMKVPLRIGQLCTCNGVLTCHTKSIA
jgi:hypothetical protein